MKSIVFNTLLVALALTGCMRKVPYEAKAGEPSKITERNDREENTEKNSFVVTAGADADPRNQTPLMLISILKCQAPILHLTALTPGKEYSVAFHCYDAQGKEVRKPEKPVRFVPTESVWSVWTHFQPDYKTNVAGNWTWVADVSGIGQFKIMIGVLAAAPDEMAELTRYEKARENALRAFSHYWLGIDGTFHTVVAYERKVPAEEQELVRRRALLEASVEELTRKVQRITPKGGEWTLRDYYSDVITRHRDLVNELARTKQQLAELPPPPRVQPLNSYIGYLEVAGLEWRMMRGPLSEADGLNGISYRGQMGVSFRVFRYYREAGWTDWEDCTRLPYMFADLFDNFFSAVPEGLASRLNLSFTIMERDGNWFVTTPSGDEFANGKLVNESSSWKNLVPPPALARDLVRGAKSFTRELYRTMGEEARNNPAAVEQSAIATMSMVRGKELIR